MDPMLRERFDDLVASMHAGDLKQFASCLSRAGGMAREGGPAALTDVIEYLAPVLPGLGGAFAKVAVLAGACVEWGGSPLPLCETVPARAAEAMELRRAFPALWDRATGGRPLPDPADRGLTRATMRDLIAGTDRAELPERAAARTALSWFDAEDWLMLMITLMAHRGFRAAMADRDRVREASAAIADELQLANWVHGLSLVLDDEPLIVLVPATGGGFALTMIGIGDNFQLHTLLADRLLDPALPGRPDAEPPEPAWVTAATDGPPRLPVTRPAVRRFRLFDGHGDYVYPEGRPADVKPLDGTRVLVVHPAQGRYLWDCARVYEHLRPALTLDRVLPPAEAASWLARVAPARETDLMAVDRRP